MNYILNKTLQTLKQPVHAASLIYFVLMVLFYVHYVWLEFYRLRSSNQRSSGSSISTQAVEEISQPGLWTSITESLFLSLFVLVMLIMMVRYRRNVRKLIPFAIGHAILFAWIGVFSLAGSQVTFMPVGNLIQPIIIPTFLLFALPIYVLYGSTRRG